MRPIQIYMYDDRAQDLSSISDVLKQGLDNIGIFSNCHRQNIDDEEKVWKDVRKLRPEIVVFDNHFGSKASLQMFGQSIIKEMKPELPDTVFVLMTGENIRIASVGNNYPGPDLIVYKLDFLNYEDYQSWVIAELSRLVRRARVDDLNFDISDFANLKGRRGNKNAAITEIEVRSLVEQACHTGGGLAENVIEGVRMRPIEGGQSGAVVCSLSVKNRFGEYNVPTIAKFMKAEAADREGFNHAKYVKWVLPYRWRVDLIGKGRTDKFGVVCYSFAHGGSGEPLTLSNLIKSGDHKVVLSVMDSIFGARERAWYSQTRERDINLTRHLLGGANYFQKKGASIKAEELIESLVVEMDLGSEDTDTGVRLIRAEDAKILVIGDYTIPIEGIFNRIFRIHEPEKMVECLSHGDLNSGNILVRAGTSEFCFIDFQNTGWHHRCRDFCFLEGSIRTLQFENRKRPFVVRFHEELDALRRLHRNERENPPEFLLVDNLRLRLFENHDVTSLEYCISSLAHVWWLLSMNNFNKFQKIRLLAFFFALYVFIIGDFVDDVAGDR